MPRHQYEALTNSRRKPSLSKSFAAAHRRRENAADLAVGASIGLRPGDGQQRIVLLAFDRLVGRLHAREHLAENERTAIAGQREPHFINVGRSPNIAAAANDRVASPRRARSTPRVLWMPWLP